MCISDHICYYYHLIFLTFFDVEIKKVNWVRHHIRICLLMSTVPLSVYTSSLGQLLTDHEGLI